MTTAASPPKPRGPIFPGWPVRIIVALAIGMIVVVRSLMRIDEPPRPLNDVAFGNLMTLILGFIAILTIWIWMCFRSGWPRLVRLLALVSPLVPILIFMPYLGLLKLEEVNGDMLPRFALRWTTTHDRQLPPVETPPAVQPIDLNTTTPEDFPQFLGPARSGWVPGPKLARDWTAQPPKLLWKRPIGAGWSAFAAVNGYAVTQEQRGDREWITCYEIATGNPVWGHSIEARHEDRLTMGGIGPRATPTIHNGRVYALGATGVLQCLDGATGKEIWKQSLLERYGNLSQAEFEQLVQWGRAGSPLIVDDLVVVPAGGPAKEAKNLAAFKAETGQVAWEATCPRIGGGTEQIAYASPALAVLAGVRQILIVNEATASGHDPATGECLWSYEWPGHSNADASSSQAVPIGDDLVLLSKGYSGGAELVQLTRGEGNQLEPESKWKNPRALQTKFTNAVIYQDHAYALSEGILECVSLADGQRRWKHTRGRYGNGQILGVDDLLLVLAEDGRLALVELTPQKFNELARIQALDGKTWNNLCLYGRRLLIRNGQEAACYELP
jgi:outer membrane protein assembly factor BamB